MIPRWYLLLLASFLAACGAAVDPDAPRPTAVPVTDPPPTAAAVPTVDVSRHSVPLEEIYFDTFRSFNRVVPLSRADASLIGRLRDAIPPIHNPRYERAAEAAWLGDEDIIVGYAAGGEAWAYPVRILNYHEIVNETLAGDPVLISYCPLCYSGIVYSRVVDGRPLTFGNTSALYESDMVMLDYETGSYWWQVAGRAIVGPLTDTMLEPLPGWTIRWGDWRVLHPETLVMSRDTGFSRNYSRDPFAGYDDVVNGGGYGFPVSDAVQRAADDGRLKPGDRVLLVKVGERARAYPLAALAGQAVHERVDGRDIVVLVAADGSSGAAYEARVGAERVAIRGEDGRFLDDVGVAWDLAGRATDGRALTPLPMKTTFWFAAVAAEPGVGVGVGGGSEE